MTNATLLDDLYRDILLDHYRNPRHHGHLATANRSADGANPLCGDQITIEARVDGDGRVEEIAFTGTGCSISQASSSMMAAWSQSVLTICRDLAAVRCSERTRKQNSPAMQAPS